MERTPAEWGWEMARRAFVAVGVAGLIAAVLRQASKSSVPLGDGGWRELTPETDFKIDLNETHYD